MLLLCVVSPALTQVPNCERVPSLIVFVLWCDISLEQQSSVFNVALCNERLGGEDSLLSFIKTVKWGSFYVTSVRKRRLVGLSQCCSLSLCLEIQLEVVLVL